MRTLFNVLFLALLVSRAMGGVAAEETDVLIRPATAALPSESAHAVPVEPETDAETETEKTETKETGFLPSSEPASRADRRIVAAQTDRIPVVEGSRLDLESNRCATCHGEAELWEGQQLRLHVPHQSLAEDVHWRHGVNCHDCHGGDPTSLDVPVAHSTQVSADTEVLPFRSPLGDVRKVCGNCHKEQRLQLRKGIHTHAGEKRKNGSGAVLGCKKCHGEKAHGMLPVHDSRSPVFLDHQLLTCGGCHDDDLKTYQGTVHGRGLYGSGLTVTAVCADCHGAHGIYYAADRRSALHTTRIAGTCGKCHRFIEERLERSVHGLGGGPGEVVEEPEPNEGGKPRRMPCCTDCHQGHHLLDPEQAPFRMQITNRCGNCHADFSSRYAMSLHGELTQLGYKPAAKCPDCHGAHEMLPVDDPHSPLLAGEPRLETCRKCHIHAVLNFSQYDPHANYKDAENYPLLHSVYHWLKVLFYSFFAFFLIHSILWFIRSFVHALGHGQHKTVGTGQFALLRFDAAQRVIYAVLFISFLGLILTGMPLKYSDQPWAQAIAHRLGGFTTTSVWHHFFATVTLVGCAAHLARGIAKIVELRKKNTPWGTILFGPDSRLPVLRDAKDLLGMGRWFLGLGPRPRFERWTYWEKFDYWAVYLTAVVIGISGLMLWYPNLFCRVLPGEALNVAKMVHEEIAILAASFLFMFHFYNTHFRPEKFPVDLSALTGLVSEEHLRKYRPDYVERLFREGRLDEIRRPAPSHRRLWLVFLAGSAVLLVGLCLLGLVLMASMGK